MGDFLKMDIFFFVSTIAFLALGVLGSIVFFYLIRILRDVYDVVHLIHEEAHAVMDDVRLVRVRLTRSVSEAHDAIQRLAVLTEHYAHALSGVTVKRFFVSLITDLVSRQEKKPRTKKKSPKKTAENVHTTEEM